MNELPPLQAMRDIRLHVLRETDSLRRMHLVRAVIHACLDELDAAPATMLDRVVRISRALLDYRELGPFTLVGAGAACVACRTWGQMAMVFVALYALLAISVMGVRAPHVEEAV